MQHHDGRRLSGRWTDHAVFEIGCIDAQGAGGKERGHGRSHSDIGSTFPPPLRGRVREGGKPQTPCSRLPPSPTLPRKGGESRKCSPAKVSNLVAEHISFLRSPRPAT